MMASPLLKPFSNSLRESSFFSKKFAIYSLIILTGYFLVTYYYIYGLKLERIDDKLYLTALGARTIIQEYPDVAVNSTKQLPENFPLIVQRLSEYAKKTDTQYIYLLEQHDGKIVFTASSHLDEEIGTDLQSQFMEEYQEYTPQMLAMLTNHEEIDHSYETISDRWGDFRSVLLPIKGKNGQRQLIGVDILLDNVHSLSKKSLFLSFISTAYFGTAIFFVLFIYNRLVKSQLSIDSGTNFPNVNALEAQINKTPDEKVLAVISCLGLAEIETLYGEEIVDECMRKVLDHYVSHLDPQYTFYRISSYRIAILLDNSAHEELFVSQLQSKPLPSPLIESPYVSVQTKIGIAKGQYGDIFNNASLAEISIRNSRSIVFLYSDDSSKIREQYENNISMSQQINTAFKNENFIPYFQPLVSAKTGEIVKYEALARLKTEDDKILSPYFFLPFIKDTPLNKKLAEVIFGKCRDMFINTEIKWSFNITASDMAEPELSAWLVKEISNYSNPENITLEILETEDITDYQAMSDCIERYHELGVSIYIDDFGTGYSNYSHFLKMKIDGLKIDGSLIKNITHDQEIRLFVDSLVQFTKALNMVVVTEFVENQEILEIVKSLGVDLLQGYHFSAPVAMVDELETKNKLFKLAQPESADKSKKTDFLIVGNNIVV